MADLWPWLVVAGLGAFHGSSPATGWMFAAAWGVRERDGAQVGRALFPIAAGHAASVAVAACAFALGTSVDRALFQGLAGALLVGVASYRVVRGARQRTPIGTPAGYAGLALWSFLMATVHGAGLTLLPALVPLCLADDAARELTASGSLLMGLTAVGVHTAAMLIATGTIATIVYRGIAVRPGLLNGAAARHAWTAALALTGALLMAVR